MAQTGRVETRETRVVEPDETPADRSMTIAERIVGIVSSIVFGLLLLRFSLSLLGANRGNMFADFIYTTSYPFVAPFFGLFNYTPEFGVGRFEYETLIAMIFWLIVAGILMRIVTLGRKHD